MQKCKGDFYNFVANKAVLATKIKFHSVMSDTIHTF